ncbi:MAG: hypothetical protein PHC34_06255 [Candidatus Gastranaerophilales bacterium]|nr:hypothetical protein [Candidatus Gastranaerophilales bacterium]
MFCSFPHKNQYNYKKSNISFEGLKENLRLGEKVLKEFNGEFGKPKSNTFINAKILQHQTNQAYIPVIQKISSVSDKYNKEVRSLRNNMTGDYPTLDEYINKLKEMVKNTNYANCGEQTNIIQYKLLQQGELPHNIRLLITEKTTNKKQENLWDHVFTVFGQKKYAHLNFPNAWGNQAVIIDAWSGIVTKAQDALDYLKQFMCFDPQKHNISYTCIDNQLFKNHVYDMNQKSQFRQFG